MADALTKLAYQTCQEGISYFSLGHRTLLTQLRQWLRPEIQLQTQAISPALLGNLAQRRADLLALDWQEAEAGVYPESLLFDHPWDDFVRYYPALLIDTPRVWERLAKGEAQSFDQGIDTAAYPQYYRRNFHYQTNGYLSEESANLYDLQVELLFNGGADAMRRRVLAPLKRGLVAIATAKAGSRSDRVGMTGFSQMKVLDVACGTGRTLKMLQGAFPDVSLYGLDLSPAYLRKANQLLSQSPQALPQLAQGQGEAMPYRDAYFDGLTCVFLFHELPGPVRQQVMVDCFRVMKPGGVLVICDSIQMIDTPELEPLMANFPALFHEPFYRDYVQDDLVQRLETAGFQDITTDIHFVSKYWVAHKPV